MLSPLLLLLLLSLSLSPHPSSGAPQLLETVGDGYAGSPGAPSSTLEDDRSQHCSDYFDDGYECVPYDLCADGEIVIDGGGVIDIRSVKRVGHTYTYIQV